MNRFSVVKKAVFSIMAVATLASMTACANNAQTGALGGAAVGGLLGQAIGHNTGATLIGAAVGGGLGYILGNEMDKNDRSQMNRAFESNHSGQPTTWRNPDSGRQYTVVPQPSYYDQQYRRDCRKAEVSAVIDGRMQRTVTTACRNSYGEWELQR